MVLDNSTLQVMVDSLPALDNMLLVLDNILLVPRGYPRQNHMKLHCSVVSLLFDIFKINLLMCQYCNTRNIDIYEYIVKEFTLLKIV